MHLRWTQFAISVSDLQFSIISTLPVHSTIACFSFTVALESSYICLPVQTSAFT